MTARRAAAARALLFSPSASPASTSISSSSRPAARVARLVASQNQQQRLYSPGPTPSHSSGKARAANNSAAEPRVPAGSSGIHSTATVSSPGSSSPLPPNSSSSSSSSSPASSSTSTSKLNKRPPSTAYQRQSRTEWGVVAVAGSAAAVGGWYYWYNVRPKRLAAAAAAQATSTQQQSRSFSLSSRTSFTIASRQSSASGGPGYKIIQSLTPNEVDRILREHERSTHVERPDPRSCLVARYDTNSVASNEPCEDKRAEVIVERDLPVLASPSSTGAGAAALTKGDLCFFAVMDGHAGYATSTLLSQKLIAFVALELDKVFREQGEYAQMAKAKQGMPVKVWNYLFGGGSASGAASLTAGAPVLSSNSAKAAAAAAHQQPPAVGSAGLDGDPEIVKRAIVKAFKGLDKEICNTPVELLKEYEISLAASSPSSSSASSSSSVPPSAAAPSRVVTASSSPGSGSSATITPLGGQTRSLSSLAHSIFPSSLTSSSGSVFTQTQKTAYEAILPALSGSCALLTYVDSARGDLYVACTGDSRAIAGWWREKEGRWEIEPLSTDQTGRNESEVRRMRSEHPAAESDTVIMRGRVLGGLEPTRAFGDARYKWDRSVQERLYDAFLPGGRASARPPPRYLQTPPYVTAEPLIEVRKVSAGLLQDKQSGAAPERELKFIVMATDGLWDMMSNEDVGGLVAGHLAGLKGDVLADTLRQHCFPGKGSPATLPPPGSAKVNNTAAPASAQLQPPPPPPVKSDAALSAEKANKAAHPLNKAPRHLKTFTFEDSNLSTHLIRNALGGGQRERVAGLLAIPAPESRSYRDDVSADAVVCV